MTTSRIKTPTNTPTVYKDIREIMRPAATFLTYDQWSDLRNAVLDYITAAIGHHVQIAEQLDKLVSHKYVLLPVTVQSHVIDQAIDARYRFHQAREQTKQPPNNHP